MTRRNRLITRHIAIATTLLCSTAPLSTPVLAQPAPEAVVEQYANIAEAGYGDALATATALNGAIDALLAAPSDATLAAARQAWLAARNPYQQTEVFRFGNAIVDDWEGRVNAWPLDEGLIDYVDASYGTESDENTLYTANVIGNPSITINGRPVDASAITPEFISQTLQEAGGIEANVASGYHAIEFLLWGQDLNGAGAGAGNRPATDFSLENCSNGNCDRRRAYLQAATQLLVVDLQEMAANWKAGGAARKAVQDAGAAGGLTAMLTGMGSLSYGELAGERMKLGLLLGDPEEEHDCFSDNTYNSHLHDAIGIRNVYLGTYSRVDGSTVSGPSLLDLVAAKDAAVAAELKADLDGTVAAMEKMAERGKTVEAYDQMIASGNTEGNAVVQAAIDGLIKQTRTIERAISVLALGDVALEGSDSLDNPGSVFK